MGTYVGAPFGGKDPDKAPKEGLGEALEDIDNEPKLGDLLAGKLTEVDIDSVEEVRKLREEE